MILPLHSSAATLELAGGKGQSLARLYQAGFPVPPGFIITTDAYKTFETNNHLDEVLQGVLECARVDQPESLEQASLKIRTAFSGGKFTPETAAAICYAYKQLGEIPVAVRSSATAEDLPDLSFAGQQDTFLNVLDEKSLLQAVKDCWGSLWTARAIGYRVRNHLDQRHLSLAVVVQVLVPAEVSGVLFTANPLNGLRNEAIINATFGLGEALVSGQVEPDQYIVQAASGRIIEKSQGAKALQTQIDPLGGTRINQSTSQPGLALTDEQILALAQLGNAIEEMYGFPQDIEWAWANGQFYVLQARPVTTLFPLPTGMPPEPLKVMFSFAAVQGMLDPITPLGQDFLRHIFAIGSQLFGIHATQDTQTVLYSAGERLWLNITTLMRNTVGRRMIPYILTMVEPTVLQAVRTIWDDPRLRPERKGIRLAAAGQIARFIFPLAANVIPNLLRPNQRRASIVEHGEEILMLLQRQYDALQGSPHDQLSNLIRTMNVDTQAYLPKTLIMFVSGVASGMASFNLLNVLSKGLPNQKQGQTENTWDDRVLTIAGGIPNNPTTEMDLALWQIAQLIQTDPTVLEWFQERNPVELSHEYQGGRLPPQAQTALNEFIERYGGRGVGEIDIGRKRWREDPDHIFEVLSGYLKIEDKRLAPDGIFNRSAVEAQAAIDSLMADLRKTRLGWFKARLAHLAASRVRALLGMRESPKFFAVRFMAIQRWKILEIGQALVKTGELDQADDLIWLTLSEMARFSAGEPGDWGELIAQRRANYQKELGRRQIPRLLLSDGRTFYEGMVNNQSTSKEVLSGSPVSPGIVEGNVRVVLDPRRANLLPGEILVCPGTDPAWTPLFLSAGGLVMEVGGMMTHGAVVAREYGIPAVVGVDQATARLETGQRIRLDGSSGQIVRLAAQD